MSNVSKAVDGINKAGSGLFKLGCGLIMIIGLIIFFVLVFRKSGSNKTDTSTSPDQATAAPISVTAKKLYGDYQANEVAADDIYKGKLIQLSGTVQSINKDFMNDPYILISVGEYNSIHCDMLNANEVKSLRRGQKVTIQGTGNGMIIDSPILKDCSLIQQ